LREIRSRRAEIAREIERLRDEDARLAVMHDSPMRIKRVAQPH
jgi:hypothetical protein